MVIVVDDADRENEGDLIMAAEHATPQTVNFMAGFGRGLICVPTTGGPVEATRDRADGGPEPRDVQNRFPGERGRREGDHHGDQRGGPARTIQMMADPTAVPEDLVQPGHVFPLRARPAGCCSARATPRRRWIWRGWRVPADRGDLRDPERGRLDGAVARAAEVRAQTSS